MKQWHTKEGMKVQIITEAWYREKKMVVYQELKEPFEIYVMEKERFYSGVKENKENNTPAMEERILRQEAPKEKTETPLKTMRPLMESFLDAQTYDEKIEILESTEEFIDANILDMMAASMDVIVEGESVEEKFFSLMQILRTRAKFEINR